MIAAIALILCAAQAPGESTEGLAMQAARGKMMTARGQKVSYTKKWDLSGLPALVLFLQHGMDDWEYFTNPNFFTQTGTGKGPASWPLLVGILGYGLVLTVTTFSSNSRVSPGR